MALVLPALFLMGAEACPSGSSNKPPIASGFEVAAIGTTVVSGIVTSRCTDPDNRPQSCSQTVTVTWPGGYRKVPVANNFTWVVSGLPANSPFDVWVENYDGGARVLSNIGRFQTVGSFGPGKLQAVVPTEVLEGGSFALEGFGLANVSQVALYDARIGAVGFAPILSKVDSRVRLQMPAALAKGGRRALFARIVSSDGYKAQLISDRLYVAASAAQLPVREEPRVQWIRFRHAIGCPYANNNLVPDEGPPYECGCVPKNRWHVGTRTDYTDPWPDDLDAAPWNYWNEYLADDASAAWSAMCSVARGGTPSYSLGGFDEVERRITLPSLVYYWMRPYDDFTVTMLHNRKDTIRLSQKKYDCALYVDGYQSEYPWCSGGGSATCPTSCEWYYPDYCEENLVFQLPDDCENWRHQDESVLKVFLHGAFYDGPDENDALDPAVTARVVACPRGYCDMLLVTDNPYLRARMMFPLPSDTKYYDAKNWCKSSPGNGLWFNSGTNFTKTFFEKLSEDPPPNLLAHGLAQPLTGALPDPFACETPRIPDHEQTTACRRGYNVSIAQCQNAIDSDLTQ